MALFCNYTDAEITNVLTIYNCCQGDLVYTIGENQRKGNRQENYDCRWSEAAYLHMAIELTRCWYLPYAPRYVFTVSSGGTLDPLTIAVGTNVLVNAIVYAGTSTQIATLIAADVNAGTASNGGFTATSSGQDVTIIAPDEVAYSGAVLTFSFIAGDYETPMPLQFLWNKPCITEAIVDDILEGMSDVCGCCDCKASTDLNKDNIYLSPGLTFNTVPK